MKYADVIIDRRSKYLDSFFTYECPYDDIRKGQKVKVTFGKGDREADAYVFRIYDRLERDIKGIKRIIAVDEDICLTEEMLTTALFMKKRYLCNTIDAVRCFLPAGSPRRDGKKRKSPYSATEGRDYDIAGLTDEQKKAMEEIIPALDNEEHRLFLLHGVTGSGKTEVYMQTAGECLKRGRNVIMLVPEISLTKQMIERFLGRFGHDKVAVMHSRMGPGERYDEWLRIRNGGARIVIGARSAVFAPLSDIGAIIIDEEHETSYKSDTTPKYETTEIAIKRAMSFGGIVIAGSATPSIVTSFRAEKGIYHRITMNRRYNNIMLPEVKTVDMRKELMLGNRSMFSGALYEGISECLKKGRQVILFLNRRGYSTFISCRECGYVMKCRECGISLVYHLDSDSAVCHYCGRKVPVPDVCPECGSRYIKYFGAGTEKLEEETKRLFPGAVTDRLDLDTVKRKGSIENILKKFEEKETDILIGTQLVAKGLDFDNVGLVGVISADVSLNIPDFRSAEKTFQIITQAAGRAGRGNERGSVVVQTYSPEHYAVRAGAMQDYDMFYKNEMAIRKALGYPPYCDMMQVVISSDDKEKVARDAGRAESLIREILGKDESRNIIGHRPAPISKLSGRYRYNIIIKCPAGKRQLYLKCLAEIRDRAAKDRRNGFNIAVDINPYSFM